MFIERLNKSFVMLDNPIAHRGCHGKCSESGLFVYENTLSAIELSIKKRIPFEIDITKTADDIPVAHHNFSIKVNGHFYKICKLTLHELRKLTKHSVYIPTLKECLEINSRGVPMVLDFKDTGIFRMSNYRKNVISLLESYPYEYAIQSFNPFFLARIKRQLPSVLIGQLICRGKTLFDTSSTHKASIGSLYERLMSLICWISNADYIGMEISCNKQWNNRLERIFYEKIDKIQDVIVEFSSSITKKPIIGWTLSDLSDLDMLPHIFCNYIFENSCCDEYLHFSKSIVNHLKTVT